MPRSHEAGQFAILAARRGTMGPVQCDDAKLDMSPAHYVAPPPTNATTPDLESLPSPPMLGRGRSTGQRRFVAGTTFFNYNAYGSLRPGHDPIYLFSSQHAGLALHFFVSGFVFYFFSYGYGRLLAEYLRANNDQQVYAAYYVLGWPSALSIGIGLISDCFPTCGYRRKGYMILGWLISLAMYAVIFILDAYSDSSDLLARADTTRGAKASPFAITYLVVSLIAAVGIQISWLAAVAASVEYGQREHIHHRGRLQATLIALYYAGGVVARLVTNLVISNDTTSDKLVSSLSVGGAAVVLSVVTLGAIPLIVCFYHEEPFTNTPHVGMALKDRLRAFWKFCHQNVVYRVLFFTIFHLFLLGLFNQNVRDAVQQWSSVDRDEMLSLEVLRMATDMASVLVWKSFLRNVDWRRLVVVGTLLYIVAYSVLTAFTAFNIVRSEAFYTVMLLIAEIPRAWLLLFTMILATEIADVGHEGVMVALVISYQTLAALADYTLSAITPNVLGLHVTAEDVTRDASTTRFKVVQAFAAIAAVNLLCLPVIKLLPQQKLDAQQQRAFGGYNKHASLALLATFVVLLCFNLAINLMAVL